MSKLSLKFQLTLGTIALGISLLLIQSMVQFHALRGELTKRIEAQQSALISEVAASLDEKFEERVTALARVGAMFPAETLGDRAALERQLRNEGALLSLFNDLYIFAPDGRLLEDWPRKIGRRGLDMSGRDYIQEVRATLQPFISRPIIGKSTGQPMIVVAAPILDGRGQLAGIIGGVLNLYQPNLLGSLPSRKIGENGYFYLMSPDRTLIAHPDKNRIMQPVTAPGVNPAVDQALAGFEGTREGVNSRGLHGLFTFKRMQTTGWILASVIPIEEAFRPIAVIRETMFFTTLALILVLSPFLWAFARRLVHPLGQLAGALHERAASIRPGMAVQPVAEVGSREIRTVARAFNEFLFARNEAEGRQRLAAKVFETATEAVAVTDPQARILAVNPAFSRITGYGEAEVVGKSMRLLRSDRHGASHYEAVWAAIRTTGEWSGEIWNRRKNGEDFPKWQAVSSVRDHAGNITNHVFIFTDLSQIRQAEQMAEHLSWHDPLTGLANRSFFLKQLEKTLADALRGGTFSNALLLDIDRFKDINEARGLALGDTLLKVVAERLSRILHPEDVLARLDSDEFAILLPCLQPTRDAAGRTALKLAEKAHEVLRQPIELDGETFRLEISIGIVLLPDGAQETAADILRQADTALHQAKGEGGGRTVFFEAAMGEAVRHRYQLEQELRDAINFGQLRLYLQPQVDDRGQEVGAEALVRWQHPERGLVLPGVFIPLAEASDLIIAVDDWMLAEVCRLLAHLDSEGRPLSIAVNISPRHFQHPRFVEDVKQHLAACGADPRHLVLEITEGMLIDNVADTVAKMAALTELGIHFSMDDFGTGYSSLAHLKRLPIHELKIDRSFIQDAPFDHNDAALVDTILAVAQHLHLQVVAEGVETPEHVDFLRNRGKIVHQGYFHGRPMPAAAWLARRKAAAVPA